MTIASPARRSRRSPSRRQSPAVAYMRGKLKVSGDTAAALKLQKLF